MKYPTTRDEVYKTLGKMFEKEERESSNSSNSKAIDIYQTLLNAMLLNINSGDII